MELASAGSITYITGRSTRSYPSPMGRPETIEETGDPISSRNGRAIPVRIDHTMPEEVAALIERIRAEQAGRLGILVNDLGVATHLPGGACRSGSTILKWLAEAVQCRP
jgi:NAD(P)-dependent dehydrogenase (short-subunit alcohol dehydrogenase family)